MRKMFTFFGALMLSTASFAQVTSALTPQDSSVFSPSAYDGLTVRYDYPVSVAGATVTLTKGGTVMKPIVSLDEAGESFTLNVDSTFAANGLATDGSFTLNVSGVVAVNDSLEDDSLPTVGDIEANYIYATTLPTWTVSPESGSALSSKTATVTFTCSEAVTYDAISFFSGTRVNPTYNALDGSTVLDTTVTTSIDSAYWSSDYNAITVSLTGVKNADGFHLPDATAEYTYEDATELTITSISPDPSEATYQQVYDEYWTTTWTFSGAIETATSETGEVTAAKVDFEDEDGNVTTVELSNYDVSTLRGNKVEIFVPEIPTQLSNTGFVSATITLVNATYNGSVLATQPCVTYYAELESEAKAVKTLGENITGIENMSVYDNEKSLDVYDVQGQYIGKDVKSLKSGLYIVKGKKVIIK